MDKAILVMDMPENCFKCKLSNWLNCRITNKCHVGEGRPYWCPLQEPPEKKKEIELQEYKGSVKTWKVPLIENKGFNACLDEILKEDK